MGPGASIPGGWGAGSGARGAGRGPDGAGGARGPAGRAVVAGRGGEHPVLFLRFSVPQLRPRGGRNAAGCGPGRGASRRERPLGVKANAASVAQKAQWRRAAVNGTPTGPRAATHRPADTRGTGPGPPRLDPGRQRAETRGSRTPRSAPCRVPRSPRPAPTAAARPGAPRGAHLYRAKATAGGAPRPRGSIKGRGRPVRRRRGAGGPRGATAAEAAIGRGAR